MKSLLAFICFLLSMSAALNVFAQGSTITLKAYYKCDGSDPSSKGFFSVTVDRDTKAADPHRATLGKALDKAVQELPARTSGKKGCIIEQIEDFK